jgi:hypothetical protein
MPRAGRPGTGSRGLQNGGRNICVSQYSTKIFGTKTEISVNRLGSSVLRENAHLLKRLRVMRCLWALRSRFGADTSFRSNLFHLNAHVLKRSRADTHLCLRIFADTSFRSNVFHSNAHVLKRSRADTHLCLRICADTPFRSNAQTLIRLSLRPLRGSIDAETPRNHSGRRMLRKQYKI